MVYRLALVQNQSEMAHYGYADARPLLHAYDTTLYTGDNIRELMPVLQRRQVDAVVLGSNALNDKTILGTLFDEQFTQCLAGFLALGRGLLVLQQVGLAMRRGPTLALLPGALGQARPVILPGVETAVSGRLAPAPGASRHVALSYPQRIDPDELRERACRFRSLPGLYWHFWEQTDPADWDHLLVDDSRPTPRPLVLVTQESFPWRIALSSLPLDWQKHEGLFHDLLLYVCEGRHNLAVVTGDEGADAGAEDYLRLSLGARQIPHGLYRIPADAERLTRNVADGIHTTLLVEPAVPPELMPTALREAVQEGVDKGRLRVVDIGDGALGGPSVSITSRELHPRRLLQATELKLQEELRTGYIDDSFWSHVESLQTLERMPDRRVDYGKLHDAAWAITQNHDRRGSYDEVLGATCAYYWLRGRYRGVDSADARATERWLRDAVAQCDPHQKVLTYVTLASLGCLHRDERDDLLRMVEELDPDEASETDLVLYVRAVVVTGRVQAAPTPVRALIARQREGFWVDLTTTATATTALLDVHEVLSSDGSGEDLRREIEASARDAVIVILRALTRAELSEAPHPYPWDGKASTTLKCLLAWLQFDRLVDLPVYEILATLRRADREASSFASNGNALTVLSATSSENAELRRQLADRDVQLGAARRATGRAVRARKVAHAATAASLLVGYLLGSLVVGLLVAKDVPVGEALEAGWFGPWQFHLAIVGLLFTAGAAQWVLGLRRAAGSEDLDEGG